MPKVLLLADGLSNGGAERQLALLARYLPPEWERRVWSMGDGPFVQVIRDAGTFVNLRERAWRFDIIPALELWRTMIWWHPDIIHSWGWMCSAVAGPACKFLRIPLVDGTARKGMAPLRRGFATQLVRKWATCMIANSQAGLAQLPIGSKQARVIYNGFDPDRFTFCSEKKHVATDLFTVVMTARMAPEKDYRTFFAVARQLISNKRQKWHFVAIGAGEERSALMSEVRDLVEQGVVSFPELGTEVLGAVRQADVGVLMSNPFLHAEGCSNSILEYMACGLPVVCDDRGGNRELVVEGKSGFLIPPCDVAALTEKLIWLRDNPNVAAQMGEVGQERIRCEFNVDMMVDKTIAVYNDVIRK